jgi:hypothetical protein
VQKRKKRKKKEKKKKNKNRENKLRNEIFYDKILRENHVKLINK